MTRVKCLLPGETGEVVVTPLQIEGMPLLRFRTGDISFLVDEPCACGRFSPRLGPILGRKKQMIKFRGTTLYPNSLYAVLDSFPGISEYYVTATSDYDLSDVLTVTVAVKDDSVHGRDDHGPAAGASAGAAGSDHRERRTREEAGPRRECPEINPIRG